MSAKTLLMIIVFAATSFGCGLAESGAGRTEAASPNNTPPTITTFDLQRVSIESPNLRSDHSLAGLQVFPGSRGRVLAPDGSVILRGTQERPIIAVQRAPGDGALLVNFGSGNYGIYSLEGAFLADLPELQSLFENVSATSWRWKDSQSLVGNTEASPPIKRPTYPDGDILPARTMLFLYEPYNDLNIVYLLQAPEPPAGTVIRLEGVTLEGALLLGIVEPEQYFGGPSKQVIGTYEVDRP